MQDIILLKQGEIVLKGLNKKYFEQLLLQNVKRRLGGLGEFRVACLQSTNLRGAPGPRLRHGRGGGGAGKGLWGGLGGTGGGL